MENYCKQQTMISVDYQRLTMKGAEKGESSMVLACFSPFSHVFIQIQGDSSPSSRSHFDFFKYLDTDSRGFPSNINLL